ncbi:MAG: envelope stress response membrane protein PspB [Acetobacteraceae bacterium]
MMVMILGILFVLVVAPIWIVAHYATEWRTGRMLSREHERALAELAELAGKLEARMDALERALGPGAGGGR